MKHSLNQHDTIKIEGPYRYVEINGHIGLNPLSLNTKVQVDTDLHRSNQGTLSFWFSPLEDLSSLPRLTSFDQKDKHAMMFPLVSDSLPARNLSNSLFGIYYSAYWYPQIIGKFTFGTVFPRMDYILEPFVYAESLPILKNQWYHLVMTWDKNLGHLHLYINNILVAMNHNATSFIDGHPVLYLGNPMMAMMDFEIVDRLYSPDDIQCLYKNKGIDDVITAPLIRNKYLPQEPRYSDLKSELTNDWHLTFDCPFNRAADLEGWYRQGPQYEPLPQFGIKDDYLIVETPKELKDDTRTFLWSPVAFEGDQWIEYDFMLESERGLALLVACASGTQREDFVKDHGLNKGGGMATIINDRIRNYHWEYMRRVEAIRTDVETQLLNKNPMQRSLHYSCIPKLDQFKWYKLTMIIEGARIRGFINNRVIFDVTDNPFAGNGPVFNFGRIALRQMYHTTMRYKNLKVYTKNAIITHQ